MPTFDEMLALAEQRAAMEVDTWIPEKPGDRIAGKIVEVGTITTKYGDYYTTTLDVGNRVYVENGEEKMGSPDKYVRVAWMGAVLTAQFMRIVPCPGEGAAFHYQKDMTPASGMNDYALINSMVFDPKTGQPKMPVNLSVHIPTPEQIMNADPRTGELPNPWELRPGETPFPSSDEPGPTTDVPAPVKGTSKPTKGQSE